MTLNRHAKARDLAERPIIKALRDIGASVELMDRPVDLLVGYRGQTILMEVKTDKAKLTEDQKEFMAEWKGGPVYTVRSVEQALACVGVE